MTSSFITPIVIFIITLLDFVTGEISSASACFSRSNKIDIQCSPRTMLRIHKVFFGYNSEGRCSFTPGDCIYTEHENYPCVGKETCSINLPSGGFGRKIPSCQQESTYFQVDYECIPAYMTRSICNVEDLRDQSGYLASPGYPNNYPSNLDCSARIYVKPNQNIRLFVIDMDLETNGSVRCMDYLYARDKSRSITLCARRANEPISIMWDELFIQLMSNGIENHKGFWLYYEADPPLLTTTTAPLVLRTTAEILEDEAPAPLTRTNTVRMQTQENKLPFVAIIGGVIGTLSFILLVLLILLGVKWWKERRRRMDKNRFIEVQNPAYRNSTEFRNSNVPSDNFYNYIDC
ncbi:CUB and sushi domain-containing protein 3-like [Saccostrea cucullata]|uniref:CUB and sushi domain-containing protein 3-like n=1 Tax=Saccostrea cuccullata TaxID=36930 RepID=UPI002ED5BD04